LLELGSQPCQSSAWGLTTSLDDLGAPSDLQGVFRPLTVLIQVKQLSGQSPFLHRPTSSDRLSSVKQTHLVRRNVPEVWRRESRVALLDANLLVHSLLDLVNLGLDLL
jgi:hypothetical protein